MPGPQLQTVFNNLNSVYIWWLNANIQHLSVPAGSPFVSVVQLEFTVGFIND
jgi:hypothetical protein